VSFGHAVHIIGFDNIQRYWIVKNSWGPDFANGGYFRIAFGMSGIGDTAIGVSFAPFQNLTSERPLSPTDRTPDAMPKKESSRPPTTCYEYAAQGGDTIPKVAAILGTTVRSLLVANPDTLGRNNRFYLQGMTLLVCNASESALPPQTQREALLRIKVRQVSATFVLLQDGNVGACPQHADHTCSNKVCLDPYLTRDVLSLH
jgi:hypothetical protein